MLINFLDSIPNEPLAQKIRAIWRVGPVGSLYTQNLPGGKGPIAQKCSNEIENALAKEGEKSRRTDFDFVLNSVKSLSERRKQPLSLWGEGLKLPEKQKL